MSPQPRETTLPSERQPPGAAGRPAPTICVAVPTYRREEVLVETLRQVAALEPPADEILVIDQTDEHDPATEAYLKSEAECGRLVWLRQHPPNLPRARNRALRESRCDVVLFIDDDVELSPGFVSAHSRNYLDGSVTAVAGKIIRIGRTHARPERWKRSDDYLYFAYDADVRLEGVASFRGCNHSVRRTTMLEAGGYDERYIGWAYREDSDAALTLWKQGKLIVYEPEASLVHLAAPTGGCRLKHKEKPLPEWMVSFPAHYFASKHLFPGLAFLSSLATAVRGHLLRKDNVFRPWRLPWALLSFTGALTYALFLARVRPRNGRA